MEEVSLGKVPVFFIFFPELSYLKKQSWGTLALKYVLSQLSSLDGYMCPSDLFSAGWKLCVTKYSTGEKTGNLVVCYEQDNGLLSITLVGKRPDNLTDRKCLFSGDN